MISSGRMQVLRRPLPRLGPLFRPARARLIRALEHKSPSAFKLYKFQERSRMSPGSRHLESFSAGARARKFSRPFSRSIPRSRRFIASRAVKTGRGPKLVENCFSPLLDFRNFDRRLRVLSLALFAFSWIERRRFWAWCLRFFTEANFSGTRLARRAVTL